MVFSLCGEGTVRSFDEAVRSIESALYVTYATSGIVEVNVEYGLFVNVYVECGERTGQVDFLEVGREFVDGDFGVCELLVR